jgi:hypothetical protein
LVNTSPLSPDELRRLVREVLKETLDELARESKESDQAPLRGETHRLDKGVLTEAMVVEIGRRASRIILGRSVAITPLARDKARALKLEIVRDKP